VLIIVNVQGNRVSLAIEDDGPGMAVSARAALFDRFHRATDEGNGAGLGLAIGDAVVRATGGEWRVGTASLGVARMEVLWHRSPGVPETGPRQEPIPARAVFARVRTHRSHDDAPDRVARHGRAVGGCRPKGGH
jgi:hypothetical protein